MKKIILSLLAFSLSHLAFAQWNNSGSNIYFYGGKVQIDDAFQLNAGLDAFITNSGSNYIYRSRTGGTAYPFNSNGHLVFQNRSSTDRDFVFVGGVTPAVNLVIKSGSGNVGIGNISPNYKLDISGDLAFNGIRHIYQTESNSLNLNSGSDGIKFNIANSTKVFLNSDGKVGIGTSSPLEKLHIESGALQFYRAGSGEEEVELINIAENETNGFFLKGMFAGTGQSGNALKFTSRWNDNLLYIRGDGKIGMGTSTPENELEVNGTIRSKKVKVEASDWPDYVFSANFELISLDEVEAFIEKNQHLPEVPSAQEVESNGIDLGSMDATLLKKVEELTLYMIEMNKTVKDQSKRIEELEKENKELREKSKDK